MRRMLSSLPLWTLHPLMVLTYGLQRIAKPSGPLVGIKDTGKVQNQRVYCSYSRKKVLFNKSSGIVVDIAL